MNFVTTNDIYRDKNNIKRCNFSSKKYKKIFNKKSTIKIDWNDLNILYHNFYMRYKGKDISDITLSYKKSLDLRFHQEIGVNKTIRLLFKYDFKLFINL